MKSNLRSLLFLSFIPFTAEAVDYDLNMGQTVVLSDVVGGVDELDAIVSTGRCYCCELIHHSGSVTRWGTLEVSGAGEPTIASTDRGAAEPIVKKQ